MNPLPSGDRTTRRLELAVFGSLGFAGVLMVALSVAQVPSLGGGAGRATPRLEAAILVDDGRAVATKVGAPVDPRAAPADLATGRIRSDGGPG